MKKTLVKKVAAVMAIAMLCAPATLSLAFNATQCQRSNCGLTASRIMYAGTCSHGKAFDVYQCANGHTYAACSTSYH